MPRPRPSISLRPGSRQLVALLSGFYLVQAMSRCNVQNVGIRTSTEADVGGQLLAGRDVRQLLALWGQHLNPRTVFAARCHPDVALRIGNHSVRSTAGFVAR